MVLKFMSVLATVFSLWLLGKWSEPWLSRSEALWLIALYAFNPFVVQFSGILMPAPYYTAAVLASFLLFREVLKKPTLFNCMGLGFLLGWASVIRAEGAVLLISIAGALVLLKKNRRELPLVLIPIVCWFAFLLYWLEFRHLTHSSDYGGDVRSLFSYWSSHFGTAIQFIGKFSQSLFVRSLLAVDLKPSALSPFAVTLVVLLCVGGIAAGFRHLWNERPAKRAELLSVSFFCGLYLTVHLFWHVALPRYCLALLPFVMAWLVHGVNGRMSNIPRGRLYRVLLLCLVFVSYGISNGYALFESLVKPNPLNAPPWHALAWLTENTPPSAKVISTISPSIVLRSKRAAFPLAKGANIEALQYVLHQADIGYIVDRPIRFVAPGVGATENLNKDWTRMRRWIRTYPSKFQLVFQEPAEKTSIYRVIMEPGLLEAFDIYFPAARDFKEGRSDEAFAKTRSCLDLYPDFGLANDLLGAIYFSRKDYSNAEQAFMKAAQSLRTSPVPLLNLASLYHREGQSRKALDFLNQGLAVISSNGNGKKYFGKIQALLQSWDRKNEIIFY
jgi:hypothetical protein